MSHFLPFQRYLLPAMLVGLALMSLLAVSRAVIKTQMADGAIDLHSYWYSGHFVRAGINPYLAYAQGLPLPKAVDYLDGSVTAPDAVAQPELARIPANTAPLLLLLSPLSFLPWTIAKIVWLVVNLALMALIPWLALRLLPPSLQLMLPVNWLAALSFYAMKGPRVALATGQTSLLVFCLMVVTLLLRQRSWLWAGVALGLALGKYSLSLPIVLFLVLEKRWRVIGVAMLVQALGLVGVTALEGGSLWETVLVQWGMLARHAGQAGVHLGYFLQAYPQVVTSLVVVGTILTLGVVAYSWWRGWMAVDLPAVNSVLVLWTLLATYHRVYDTLMVILFLILCLSVATKWQLPTRQVYGWGLFWLILVAIVCLPGEIVPPFFTAAQAQQFVLWVEGSMTIALVAMWVANLWLLPRTPRTGDRLE